MATSYNVWDPATMPVSGAWQRWDPTMTPTQYYGTDSGDVPAPTFNVDPQWLSSVGYNGPIQDNNQFNQQNGNQSATTDPALINWLNNNGYQLQLNSTLAGTPGASSKQLGRLVDAQGNQIGQGQQWGEGNEDAFLGAALFGSGFAGAAALGAGAAGAGAGADAGAAGGSGISADSAAYGSLENGAAYGGGAGDSLTASAGDGFGGALGDTGATSSGLSSTDAASLYGANGYGAAASPTEMAAGGASGGTAAGGTAAGSGSGLLGSSGGLFGSGITAQQAGSIAGAAGGLLGNKSGLNSATTSVQNQVDPRIAQYIYGANGNGGLLAGVNQLYQQQMASGGLNPLQQQGIASQLAVLQNPNYTSGFNQMRGVGAGLLGQPIAGNPFTSGQMSLTQGRMPNMMQPDLRKTIQPVGLLGTQ